MLLSLQSGSGERQGNGAGPCASEVPGPTGEKQPESEVRAEGGVEGAASEARTRPRGGAAVVGCGRRPPSRGPCGAWRLPAPTSASSATAPSLGRRAQDRVGPDAGYERASSSTAARVAPAGRGLARGIVGKAWGGSVGRRPAGWGGRAGGPV